MAQAPGPDSLTPGCIVGPWRIDCRVGRGTYGVVFQATRAGHPESDPVAIKVAYYPDDPRFAREVGVLTRIRHPAVPALVDQGVWEAPGGESHPYIVMQWVDGLPLYEWAKVYNPTSKQVLHVLAQVAWALEAVHAEVCLHRDVKGDNIKVRRDGKAFLMDFGSSTWAGAPRITDGPMAPGTRGYRGPEAMRFQWYYRRGSSSEIYEATEADDIYALGVSAYRMVTGQYPPPGTDPERQLDPERPPPPARLPPRAVNTRVVPEVAALIERMLAEVPQARPAAQAVALAAQVAAEQGGPEADVPLSPFKKQSRAPVPENKGEGSPPPSGPGPRWKLIPVVLCCFGGLWLAARCPSPHGTVEETAQVVDIDKPDAGTSGVGDAVSMATADSFASQIGGRNVLGTQVPPQPFHAQIRPDKHGKCPLSVQVVINGGCWKVLDNIPPPCADSGYEWKDGCYIPVFEMSRPPTSDDP
jgi:serine/threonine protein kinase